MKYTSVTSEDISVFGTHKKSCDCEICERVRNFREELEDTKFKLVVRD